MLCGLIAPSHAFVHVAHWGCEVNVHGMVVQDGDLIHADRHGAVVVPLEAVRGVLGKLDLMVRKEAVILEAARTPRCHGRHDQGRLAALHGDSGVRPAGNHEPAE